MSVRSSLLLAAVIAIGTLPAVARECAAIDADARNAEVGGDLAKLAELYDEASKASACDGAWVARLGDDVAKAHVNAFFWRTESSGGGEAAMREFLPVLEEGRRYGEPWQLLLTLAEVRYEFGEYDAAAPLYENAVAGMAEVARAIDPKSAAARELPSVEDFKVIHARMTQAALLAKAYEPPAARRGAPQTGLFVESWRGYAVKAVPLPIQFEFGTTEFTETGRRAADYLASYLKASGKRRVTLVGHTDPVGSEAENLTLSVERAKAVGDYVKAAGFAGEVAIEGKGEAEPFRAVDAARFTDDQQALHALDRRVELIR